MNIGIDIRAIGRQRTGDETYTLGLVKALLAIDKENRYQLYTNTDNPAELAMISQKLGLASESERVQLVPILPASKLLWTFWSLPRHLRHYPVDVLHVQYITPQWLPAGIKLVTTIHDISFNFFPQFIKKTDLLFLKTLVPFSLKRADKIIGVSEFTKRELLSYYKLSLSKVVAVNNGVEPEYFEPLPQEVLNSVKAKYELPEQFMLYVGTHQPRKNIPFLLEGFKQLKEKYVGNEKIDNLHLVLTGNRAAHNHDPRIDQALEGMTINHGPKDQYIHFPGYIAKEDLPALYQLATIFVFPSLYEGFGIPMVEAMASGTPVVCSNSSCLPEVANGAAAIYQSDNSDDFIQHLYSVVTDQQLRDNLTLKGRLRAQELSWEEAAKQTLAVFQQAYNGS